MTSALRTVGLAATWVPLVVGTVISAGCGSSNSNNTANAAVLDPTVTHYGNTDDEWGALWWQWIYQLPQTSATNCNIPFLDPTGADCAVGQTYGVFFLVGTEKGTVVRNDCVVPAGKAIFFPIVNFSDDNGGVPPNMQMTDPQLMQQVQTQLNTVPVSGLSAEFDGVAITDLARFKTDVTMFSYTLPPEPNVYDCGGQTGVTGLINPSYAAGYYIMLAPPANGAHTLHFTGNSPMSQPPLMIDVTYNFMVQ